MKNDPSLKIKGRIIFLFEIKGTEEALRYRLQVKITGFSVRGKATTSQGLERAMVTIFLGPGSTSLTLTAIRSSPSMTLSTEMEYPPLR